VRELLVEPNLSLLPPDYAEGTRHDPVLQPRHAHPEAHGGAAAVGPGGYYDEGGNWVEGGDAGDAGAGGGSGGGGGYSSGGDGGRGYDALAAGFGYELPMAGAPAADLRRRKGRNRFLAEVVYLFCEQRDKYDALARDFTRKYAIKARLHCRSTHPSAH